MKRFIFAHVPSGTNILILGVTDADVISDANAIMKKNRWSHFHCVLDREYLMKDKYPATAVA